jgi:hypothetical protein
MKFFAYLTRIHKWVGLVIGVQILLWTAGGVVMSVAPIEAVRSEALIAEPAPLTVNLHNRVDPMRIASAAGFTSLDQMSFENFAGEPVWRMQGNGRTALVSAASGQSLLPLSEHDARKLARADYAGTGELLDIKLVNTGPIEVRGREQVYRVTFSKPRNYTVWIDPEQGRIIAHRSSLWRFYDFFWMLHIMDYDERDNFNHPLLILFAISALLFVLTGFGLLVHRILLRPRRKKRS